MGKNEKSNIKNPTGTYQIDYLQESHDDFTRSPPFQNFQDRKHSVCGDQLTLHLGSLGHDTQLFFFQDRSSRETQVNE